MELLIPAGCAVTLAVDGATFRLRTLAEARLVSDHDDDGAVWSVPVMVTGDALGLGEGRARFATHVGLVHVRARLVTTDDGLVLEGLGTPQTTQRRMAVRQPIELPLRLRVPLNPPSEPLRRPDDEDDAPPRWDPDDVADVVPTTVGPVVTVTGSTLNVSAGGIMARLDRHLPELLPRHRGIIVELTLPDGEVVEAEMTVVELQHSTLRGPFTAISPRGRERLTRVVFAYEREALAERRRRQEMSDRVGHLPPERRGFGGL